MGAVVMAASDARSYWAVDWVERSAIERRESMHWEVVCCMLGGDLWCLGVTGEGSQMRFKAKACVWEKLCASRMGLSIHFTWGILEVLDELCTRRLDCVCEFHCWMERILS